MGRLDEVVETSEKTFQAALGQIRPAVDAMMETLSGLRAGQTRSPRSWDQARGEGRGVLASADAEAQFTVSLKWKAAT